jgi:hypothetical protein
MVEATLTTGELRLCDSMLVTGRRPLVGKLAFSAVDEPQMTKEQESA